MEQRGASSGKRGQALARICNHWRALAKNRKHLLALQCAGKRVLPHSARCARLARRGNVMVCWGQGCKNVSVYFVRFRVHFGIHFMLMWGPFGDHFKSTLVNFDLQIGNHSAPKGFRPSNNDLRRSEASKFTKHSTSNRKTLFLEVYCSNS